MAFLKSSFLRSVKFWEQTVERAVKTFAQTAAALAAGDGLGIIDVHWLTVVNIAALAMAVSVLTSVGSGPFGDNNSPSLVE